MSTFKNHTGPGAGLIVTPAKLVRTDDPSSQQTATLAGAAEDTLRVSYQAPITKANKED